MQNTAPFLVDTGKGFSLKYRNRNLYSPINPEESTIAKLKELSIAPKTLVLIPSPCLGYGLKELSDKMPEEGHILCVEWDRELGHFLETQAPLQETERLSYLITDDQVPVIKKLRDLGLHNFRRLLMIRLTGGYMLHREEYDNLQELLEKEIRNYWQNKITLIHMAPLWIKNIFTNLHQAAGAHSIAAVKLDKPVMVTGAGASLEEAIPLIKKHRQSLTLVTVDTAFPVLWHHGIKPDYIFIVESQLANLFDFIPCRDPGVPVVCDLTSYPQLFRMMKEQLYLFCSHFYPTKLLNRLETAGLLPPLLLPLGSVGVAALFMAMKISSGPVIGTGLDFSYTKNKSHSSGAPMSELMLLTASRTNPPGSYLYGAIKRRPLLKAQSQAGKPLLTDLVLKSYAEKTRELFGGDKRFFTLGEEGLDIGATPLKPEGLEDLLTTTTAIPSEAARPAEVLDFSEEKIVNFFQEELKLLQEMENRINGFLHKGIPLSDSFQKLLLEMDYLYLHFPEHISLPCTDKNTLFRILISVGHYRDIIQRAK